MRKHKTLILNKAYYPINVVGWKDAIVLTMEEKNIVLSEYEDTVSSVNKKFRIPSVIVITDHYRPNKAMKYSKHRLFVRDGHLCAYCGHRFAKRELTVDHILPKSKGGVTSWENCISSCLACNGRKANNTPEEARMELLFKPYIPKYNYEYFLNWSGYVPSDWLPYLPVSKKTDRPEVKEIVPELKYGRKPSRSKMK